LVCEVQGELVALAGLTLLEAGFFEAGGSGVCTKAGPAATLDVAQELAALESALEQSRLQLGESS
jgi:hypothetical protein